MIEDPAGERLRKGHVHDHGDAIVADRLEIDGQIGLAPDQWEIGRFRAHGHIYDVRDVGIETINGGKCGAAGSCASFIISPAGRIALGR